MTGCVRCGVLLSDALLRGVNLAGALAMVYRIKVSAHVVLLP